MTRHPEDVSANLERRDISRRPGSASRKRRAIVGAGLGVGISVVLAVAQRIGGTSAMVVVVLAFAVTVISLAIVQLLGERHG